MNDIEKKLREKSNWQWSGNIYEDEDSEGLSLILKTPWSNNIRMCVQVDAAEDLAGIVAAFEFSHLDHAEIKIHRGIPYVQPRIRLGSRSFEARLPQDRLTPTAFRLIGGFYNSHGEIISGPALILESDQILLTCTSPQGEKFSGRFKTAGLHEKLEAALVLLESDLTLNQILCQYNTRVQPRRTKR